MLFKIQNVNQQGKIEDTRVCELAVAEFKHEVFYLLFNTKPNQVRKLVFLRKRLRQRLKRLTDNKRSISTVYLSFECLYVESC